MSRLDSFIRRLEAQRRCLEYAVGLVEGLEGPVFELGLGNGRTFDHLREICPNREIFVFERRVQANPDSTPAADHLFEGPIAETLPAAIERFGRSVPLVHADLGSGRPEVDRETSRLLAGHLPDLMRPGGIVLSDQDLPWAAAARVGLPAGVAPGRYFIYRAP